jgi:hypothetical protein
MWLAVVAFVTQVYSKFLLASFYTLGLQTQFLVTNAYQPRFEISDY